MLDLVGGVTTYCLSHTSSKPISAVGLGDQRSSLIVCQDWGELPIEAFGPFRSVFIAGVSVLSLHENPTFYRTGAVETLPGLALREGRTVASNFLAAIS